MYIKQLWKKLNYYDRAMSITFFLQNIFFVVIIIYEPDSLLFHDWFVGFLSIPQFFSSPVSGMGYGGRAVDGMQPNSLTGTWERRGTILGIGAGIGLGVALNIFLDTIPFFHVLSYVACILLAINTINTFSGIGNRIGQFFDPQGRAVSEKRSMMLAALIGIGLGIALCVTHYSTMFSIAGVLTFATGGTALPVILACVIFTARFSAIMSSAADYTAKAVNYYRQDTLEDEAGRNNILNRQQEYKGAARGLATGVIVAAVIITALALTQPYIFLGFIGIAVATMICITCISIFGKLLSTYGRYVDANERLEKEIAISAEEACQKKIDPPQEIVLDSSGVASPQSAGELVTAILSEYVESSHPLVKEPLAIPLI